MIKLTLMIKAKDAETENKVAASAWLMANPACAGRKWEAEMHIIELTDEHSTTSE